MASSCDYLFSDGNLDLFLRQRIQQVSTDIGGMSSDYLLKVSLDDLSAHLTEKFHIQPIELLRDQTHIVSSGETKIDVSGDPRYGAHESPCLVDATFVEFAVPFTGDAFLLRLKPSTYNYNPPRAKLKGQELRFVYSRTDHNAGAIKTAFKDNIDSVAQFVEWGSGQVHSFNKKLPLEIRPLLEGRRQKFLKDRGLVEALGFPITPRPTEAQTYVSPLKRKPIAINKPTVAAGAFKPEPVLDLQQYEHILTVISNMVQVMERSPNAFKGMGEEDLRTHILVQLNGHYEGQASGETFNFEGKTDILIRADGRNIFIAECKIWKGAGVFTAAIDQFLGYAAWRDTKTAIIIFNRNKDLSSVIKQIPDLIKAHPNFKRQITSYLNETGFRFVLHHRGDKNRELTLTVLVFDIPT